MEMLLMLLQQFLKGWFSRKMGRDVQEGNEHFPERGYFHPKNCLN
jgi:hypothetical protein